MVAPERPPSSASFKERLKWFERYEKPKIDTFDTSVMELHAALFRGEIDETTFFRRLIEDTQPITTTSWLANQAVIIERTPNNTIEITRRDLLYYYLPVRMKTVIRIDEEGRLEVKADASWEDPEGVNPDQKIEEDEILTRFGMKGISQQEWANRFAYALMGIEMEYSHSLFEVEFDGILLYPEQDPFSED